MKKDDFIFKFKKEPRAKPVFGNDIRVPNFSDKTTPVGAHGFVLWGDASNVDLSNAGSALSNIRFGNTTIFPSVDKMPKDFNPDKVLEDGKAPGLHISDLHAAGITGKGIIVAIIDQTLNTEHIEIKDNIVHYESIGYTENEKASYHGTTVSSILAGKTVGVAPDTKIVYFAANNHKDNSDKVFAEPKTKAIIEPYLPTDIKYDDFITDVQNYRHLKDKQFQQLVIGIMHRLPSDLVTRIENARKEITFDNYAAALRKILFMNARLPKDKKISAVSISWGTFTKDAECAKLINLLIESGVMVLPTSSEEFYGKKGAFTTIDREMNSDADDVKSYSAGFWKTYSQHPEDTLLVPSGGRTVAGFYDDSHYIYCGSDGGQSWATPYLVGVYALAKQVMPTLTPEHFFSVAHHVGASNQKLGNNVIIQPQRIIEYLQNEKLLQKHYMDTKNMSKD